VIELKINGQAIMAEPGMNVLQAALAHHIDIPHICYHPDLSISGGCRLCLVEVEGRDFPVPSCGLSCEDGMVVQTESEELTAIRRDIIDLFVSDHPLDCVTCEKAGDCLLQHYAYKYGITETSYEKNISRSLYQDDNPFFVRDHQYCILCGRCTRVCREVIGADAIDMVGRGFESYIATPFDWDMKDSSCVFCGSCVQLCPTAALMPVSRQGKGREWELDRVKSICGFCGVGCQVEYAKNNGDIIYAQATSDGPVNGEFLCTKGRYGWDFADHPERLISPMIRRDVAYELGLTDEPWELPESSPLKIRRFNIEKSFLPVDWDTALDYTAEKLAEIVQQHGPDSVMGLASARCTNEDNYVFQKFVRASIGTNNLDHCARL
jgi:formate dehydrogenase alpha subunit